jgi:DNA repair exonuclease SbcCD ATPase subunit
MFKLKYLKATNFIGFRSGLGKKVVEIDLTEMLDKNLILILGDNGMGKSTFASLIPPSHTPFASDKTFILDGKEGLLIREYIAEDGQIYSSKCVYMPKKDGGHSTKAHFGIYQGNEYLELNPTGNIESYYILIETHFNINRALLNLTYYDDNIKGLIKMTRSERISSINKYIPTNNRYIKAFDVINEKYKSSRNIMKNTIQKLNNLRDEKKLSQNLETIETFINNKSERYEELIKKISVLESNMERLLQGRDIDAITNNISSISEEIKILRVSIRGLKNVNLEMETDDLIKSLEKIIYENQIKIDNSNFSKLKEELYSLEESLEKYESVLAFSDIDINEMENLLVKIENDINSLTYTKNPSLYSKMSMTEIEILDKNMINIIETFDNLFSSNSELMISYYKGTFKYKNVSTLKKDLLDDTAEYERTEKLIHDFNMKLSYYNGFGDMKEKLSLRPKTCTIDSCVFIADALKWSEYEIEIGKLNRELDVHSANKVYYKNRIKHFENMLEFITSVQTFDKLLRDNEKLIKRYLSLSYEEITKSISKGFLPEEFNFYKLRDLMAILSEKELYEELINVTKPSIKNKIEIYKAKADNISLVNFEIEKINKKIDSITKEIIEEGEKVKKYKEKLNKALSEKELLDSIIENNKLYIEHTKRLDELISEFETYDAVIRELTSIKNDLKEYKYERNYINDELSRMYKERDTLKFELIQVKDLKLEISIIEQQFMILDILKLIAQPGKGINKDTIDIFMEDIQETANILLSKTFNGKFVLLPFIIDEDTFDMPYSFNGVIGTDLADASSAQRSIASNCISLAILSKVIDKYGIMIMDEPEKTLSPDNREMFVPILADYTRYIGITQTHVISHSPEIYSGHDVGYVLFPGFKLPNHKDTDHIKL